MGLPIVRNIMVSRVWTRQIFLKSTEEHYRLLELSCIMDDPLEDLHSVLLQVLRGKPCFLFLCGSCSILQILECEIYWKAICEKDNIFVWCTDSTWEPAPDCVWYICKPVTSSMWKSIQILHELPICAFGGLQQSNHLAGTLVKQLYWSGFLLREHTVYSKVYLHKDQVFVIPRFSSSDWIS